MTRSPSKHPLTNMMVCAADTNWHPEVQVVGGVKAVVRGPRCFRRPEDVGFMGNVGLELVALTMGGAVFAASVAVIAADLFSRVTDLAPRPGHHACIVPYRKLAFEMGIS